MPGSRILTSVKIHWSTYLPFSIKSYSSVSSLSTIATPVDRRTLDDFVDLNEISLPGSYSDASASSSEVDEVGRSEVVCGMSGYRPFDESDGLSCFDEVGS